jgi:hypothetical protein
MPGVNTVTVANVRNCRAYDTDILAVLEEIATEVKEKLSK